MAANNWTVVAIPTNIPVEQAKATDYVISASTEIGHEIENNLKERLVGNKKDWTQESFEETIEVTFPYDQNFKTDKDLVETIKYGRQMRIWLINNAVVTYTDNSTDSPVETEGHNSTFAYVIPESRSLKIDDESEELEASYKVKLNSATGNEPKLPEEILDAAVARQVLYENIGQETGDLEDVAYQNAPTV
ncbi:hypothetical protein [Macrococcus armenti]|uniref:hypothetical protein n=1 Tax=Macrococcus armenti TaxID=2875764 RepID=UPI001CD35D53|nr:hypothetical protein [Macrococcus armenti]UBH10075.1 hypothetical protein LAU38_07250 [Macrococcus armenti]